jgi:hypothetical protein
MIELPRAALVADEIAKEAEFFSFGTNDLTQTTFGFSRDDVNKVLPTYLAEGILKQDPFAALDQEGVGQLVKMATERGRKTRQNLKVGICGEHGGEPSSVEFCYKTGSTWLCVFLLLNFLQSRDQFLRQTFFRVGPKQPRACTAVFFDLHREVHQLRYLVANLFASLFAEFGLRLQVVRI